MEVHIGSIELDFGMILCMAEHLDPNSGEAGLVWVYLNHLAKTGESV